MQNRWAEWVGPYPWEQQEEETDRAYRAFTVYRDMGIHRSLRKTAQTFYGLPDDDPATTQKRQLAKWSSAHRWVERVSEFDAFSDYTRWADKQESIRQMEQRHAAIAVQVQRAALDKLEDLSPREMSAADVIRYLEKAVQIERLARGEATTRSEYQAPGGGPVEIAVSVEDLERRVVELLAVRPPSPVDEEDLEGDDETE